MKIFRLLTVFFLLEPPAALTRASLVSTCRALVVLTTSKQAASKVNTPVVLAVAAERTKEFATKSVPRATVQAFQACKANPGTTVICGTAGIGLLFAATPAAVAAPVLAAVGFGGNGVVLGIPPVLPSLHSAMGMLYLILTPACLQGPRQRASKVVSAAL